MVAGHSSLHVKLAGVPPVLVRRIVTFILICCTWVFFRAGSLGEAVTIFRRLLPLRPGDVLVSIGKAQLMIGLGLVVTTLLSGLIASSASGVHLGVIGRVAGYVIAAALDVGIFYVLRDRARPASSNERPLGPRRAPRARRHAISPRHRA